MVSQNRIKEFYSPAPSEQCCNCRQPLEPGGAWYWGRIRVCHQCYRDEVEWQADGQKAKLLRLAGWWAIGVGGGFLVACVLRVLIYV
jgi:hypothetical protein